MDTPRCPAGEGVAEIRRCPFLHNVGATGLGVKLPCPAGHGPVLAEDDQRSFASMFSIFHGAGGVLPLPHLAPPPPQQVLYPPAPVPAAGPAPAAPKCSHADARVPLGAPILPLASLSMSWGSNWFNIHHLLQQHFQQHHAQQRKPPQQHQPQPERAPGGGVLGPGPSGPGAASMHEASSAGKCPMRRALGPLAGIVFNKQGHLSCPEPIVKMRAALAATRPVRELRPQALPIKFLAVAMTTAALNVPCGMWREHTEKFSSQWFIAVHATIPFIAMLRKAVIMPKYAILFTICAAIAGQAMGARLERRRLHGAARNELAGLARARAVVASSASSSSAAVSGSSSAGGSRQHAALPVASLLLASKHRPAAAAPPAAAAAATALGTEAGGVATAGAGAAGEARALVFRVRPRSVRRGTAAAAGGGQGAGLVVRCGQQAAAGIPAILPVSHAPAVV